MSVLDLAKQLKVLMMHNEVNDDNNNNNRNDK